MNLKHLIDHKIYTQALSDLPMDKKCIINTINPHSYITAKKDAVFAEGLLDCDVLLPDGIGIVFATKILRGKKIERIAGSDLHHYLLTEANKKGLKVFYLGATDTALKLIEKRLQIEYPKIRVMCHAPSFKTTFSSAENTDILKVVNAFAPDILFVGLSAPKQEKWVHVNKEKTDATIIASVGAVFDFYSGTFKRSEPFWIKLGLEWLPRLIRDPQRMWKRNFVSTPLFLFEILKEKLR
jgi:N-acetylglucosaminyldiphosphoundecaprenol N-acetyl-beta-D-mannosaminyltransferase